MRRFSVGEVVTWIPDLLLRSETHGDYRIVAAMPDRDGDHMYRIKSPLEEYERVVKEDLLVKSKAFSPKEPRAGVPPSSTTPLGPVHPAEPKAPPPTPPPARGEYRARRERPRRRHTAEQREELAAFQLVEVHSVPRQPEPCR